MKTYKIIEPQPFDDSDPTHHVHVMDSREGIDWDGAKAAVLDSMKKQIEWAKREAAYRQQQYDEVTALNSERAFREYFEPEMVTADDVL